MAEPINIESVVDDLSKPENKAELDKALNDAFKEATTPADDKTAAPEGENKAVETTKEDPSQQKAGEADKPKSRVEELLADRNAAKAQAADAQTEVQVLTKQVENLTKMIETLSAGKGGERGADDGTADDTNKGKTVEQIVEETLAKREAANNADANAEKSITDQIQALEADKDTPNAKDYADNLKAIMAKHPTISAYAAYRMLQGEGIIPMSGVVNSNANRTGTGNRSKTNLLDTKKPEEMSTGEMLSFLKGAEKSGELKGLI